MKLYVASSWKNTYQPWVVEQLRSRGHEVYDFRHPPGGDHLGFSWSDVDPEWRYWSADEYLAGLEHPIAQAGFDSDWGAMQDADAGVLVLPAGRSAHLEAGYFVGAKKPLYILLDPGEYGRERHHGLLMPFVAVELMYKMATAVYVEADDLWAALEPASAVGWYTEVTG